MLSIADTPWHVISAIMVFFVGLVVAMMQRRVFRVPVSYAVGLYLWHTVFCAYYFYYSLSNVADAQTYYLYSLNIGAPFALGTVSIYYLVAIFSDLMGMSYLGVFLVFNIFGYVGMVALASVMRSLLRDSSQLIRTVGTAALLLPSLSFWSSAPGKDSLAFMAVGLMCWAAPRLQHRYPAALIATAVFLAVRPHMAAILIASLAATVIFADNVLPRVKAVLIALAAPAAVAAVIFGAQYVGFREQGNLSGLASYVETRQGYNLEGGSSVDIASMNVPFRMFTYLFRPLFFDTNSILGIVVSVENLILLLLSVIAISRMSVQRSLLSMFESRFYLLYIIVSWALLANTTANLGIAIRQKWMFLPMLLLIIVSYLGRSKPRNSVGRKIIVGIRPAHTRGVVA